MNRIARLRRALAKRRLSGYLGFLPSNLLYLTGFGADTSCIVVDRRRATLVVPPLLYEQARAGTGGGVRVVSAGFQWKRPVAGLLPAGRVAVEAGISVGLWRDVQRLKNGRPVRLTAENALVEELRSVKDAEEMRCIRRACRIVAEAMRRAAVLLRPGRTEKEIADELDYFMRRRGAEKSSFDLIVGSGPNSALPHHASGSRRLRRGDAVVVDIGCRVRGYCSDMTRTFFVGKPDAEQRRIHRLVAEAQAKGIRAVRDGAEAASVDAAARQVLREAGYEKFFIHGTGHGVGLEIHEAPRLGPGSRDLLRENMVVTVEPGLYFPGRFGVRIEDIVRVARGGCEVLTR